MYRRQSHIIVLVVIIMTFDLYSEGDGEPLEEPRASLFYFCIVVFSERFFLIGLILFLVGLPLYLVTQYRVRFGPPISDGL